MSEAATSALRAEGMVWWPQMLTFPANGPWPPWGQASLVLPKWNSSRREIGNRLNSFVCNPLNIWSSSRSPAGHPYYTWSVVSPAPTDSLCHNGKRKFIPKIIWLISTKHQWHIVVINNFIMNTYVHDWAWQYVRTPLSALPTSVSAKSLA